MQELVSPITAPCASRGLSKDVLSYKQQDFRGDPKPWSPARYSEVTLHPPSPDEFANQGLLFISPVAL